jgi:hypothetical protein
MGPPVAQVPTDSVSRDSKNKNTPHSGNDDMLNQLSAAQWLAPAEVLVWLQWNELSNVAITTGPNKPVSSCVITSLI